MDLLRLGFLLRIFGVDGGNDASVIVRDDTWSRLYLFALLRGLSEGEGTLAEIVRTSSKSSSIRGPSSTSMSMSNMSSSSS